METQRLDRRGFFRLGFCAGSGLLVLGPGHGIARAAGMKEEERVSANEDLMREHGVLVRLLLVYENVAGRLAAGDASKTATLRQAAATVQRFIEEYHERMEERFVFPRLEKSDLGELVRVLLAQHQAGRALTTRLLTLTGSGLDQAGRDEAVRLVETFRRMYLPHLAREDTVLFPAYHASLPEAEYGEMGERFEDVEHETLGEGGFENTLKAVEDMERELGIFDIAQFTPGT